MIKVGDEVYIQSNDYFDGMYGEVTYIEEYLGEFTYDVYFCEIDRT